MYYSYSAAQWLLVFYLYCMLGWCFESTVVSVGQRRLVNRGFLRGPMLPIYGFGAVILLHVSLPLKQHPVWLYLASMIAATVFEYIVGVVMEQLQDAMDRILVQLLLCLAHNVFAPSAPRYAR